MSIITATNYKGRLHVGYGDEDSVSKCLGKSINSYRNPISKFFTKLYGFSMDIDIGGKIRCVNIESFKKHLQSIGLEGNSIEQVRKLGYKAFIQNNSSSLIIGNDKLGENFSDKKRMKLFKKMIKELSYNNTQRVKRLIRKGAYVDREFYKPSAGALSGKIFFTRSQVEETLFDYFSNINYYSYTPLSLAAEKENQSLAKFILNVKNDDISSDKKQTFNFTMTRRGYQLDWNTETKVEQVSINDGKISIAYPILCKRYT